MQFQFSVVFIYLAISAAVVGLAIFIGRFIRPQVPDPDKASIYECGERPIGSAWFNFNPRFYLLALVFIVFDVEIALTYPVAVVVKDWIAKGRGGVAVLEVVMFLAILVAALAYVWGKGELNWVRELSDRDEPSTPEEPSLLERPSSFGSPSQLERPVALGNVALGKVGLDRVALEKQS